MDSCVTQQEAQAGGEAGAGGMSFFPGHWACLMSLRVSAGNAVTDAVWVEGGSGERTVENSSREAERCLSGCTAWWQTGQVEDERVKYLLQKAIAAFSFAPLCNAIVINFTVSKNTV